MPNRRKNNPLVGQPRRGKGRGLGLQTFLLLYLHEWHARDGPWYTIWWPCQMSTRRSYPGFGRCESSGQAALHAVDPDQ
ncbi:hypothetical protein GQ53DRAFT_431945 [Thozetella sp. PMI_491]|nr:hypothetical protein GQ53DRAFT_431945 [Thozetella sp. PMI_491]